MTRSRPLAMIAATGFRCPLTDLAESHGAASGSLPRHRPGRRLHSTRLVAACADQGVAATSQREHRAGGMMNTVTRSGPRRPDP